MTIFFSLEGVLVNQKLEWLQGSKKVFEGVSDFARSIGWDVKVLAKYNKKQPESKQEIIDWCLKNLGLSKSKIKPVPNNEDKLTYANPESFLIDSKIEIVNGFMYSGGTAILFDGLASGVKKIKFLIETIKELEVEATMNNGLKSLQYPPAILQSRLKYLFSKSGFDSVQVQYDACRCTAYDEADSYLSFWADPALGLEGQTELGIKFDSVTALYFEQQEFLENPWSVYTIETQPLSTLPQKTDFGSELEKKLYEYYMKENKPYMKHYDKSLFSKIQKNIEKNQNLKNFMFLHYSEQISILMFVYMNLVANMLQEELAGKVD